MTFQGFKVTSATLNMVGDAAHWYHAYKLCNQWPDWKQLQAAVLAEFDINVHRDKMKCLMLFKQVGTVEEYKREFNQLVYQLRLYESAISDTFLVTRFVLGLKEELRAAVEIQLPKTVSKAATYAVVQEEILLHTKPNRALPLRPGVQKPEIRINHTPAGELWKARQLKEYKRQNGLCFSCGEKFIPGHVCEKGAAGQLHALDAGAQEEILSDNVLDEVIAQEAALAEMQLSVNALSGADHPSTIRLRAMTGNQVLLIL